MKQTNKPSATSSAKKNANGTQQIKSASTSPLEMFFLAQLKEMYYCEQHLIDAIPKMKAAATTEELEDAFEEHLSQTEKQLKRLEKISEFLSFPTQKTCRGLEGILSEGEKTIKEISDNQTKDAAIIASAQRVEHYEIAGYGTAAQFARDLGLTGVADLLEETLNEEKETDAELSTLAKGGFFKAGLNEQAVRE